jgi:hypothetical protein
MHCTRASGERSACYQLTFTCFSVAHKRYSYQSQAALSPAVQINHPKNIDSADCLPVPARRTLRLSGRSAENSLSTIENISDSSTPTMGKQSQIIFSGGLWTAPDLGLCLKLAMWGWGGICHCDLGRFPCFDEHGEIRLCDYYSSIQRIITSNASYYWCHKKSPVFQPITEPYAICCHDHQNTDCPQMTM